jgi:hypothetical protein
MNLTYKEYKRRNKNNLHSIFGDVDVCTKDSYEYQCLHKIRNYFAFLVVLATVVFFLCLQLNNVWLSFLAMVLFITTGVGAGLLDRKMEGYV